MKHRIFNWKAAFLFMILLAPAFASADLNTDVFAYYSIDDTNRSGNTIYDLVASNDLTNTGGTLGVSGILGEANDLDGSADYMDATSYQTSGPMTISFWVDLDTLKTQQFFSSGAYSGSFPGMLLVGQTNGETDVWIGNGAASTKMWDAPTGLSAAAGWQHFVFTWDGTTASNGLEIYIDGSSIGTATSTKNWTGNSHIPPRYGAGGAGNEFVDGKMDEIGYWDRVLNSTEISELYNSGSALSYYDFNSSSPPVSASYATVTVKDIYDNASLSGLTVYIGTDSNVTDGSGTATVYNYTGLNYTIDGGSLYFNASGTATANSTVTDYLAGAIVTLEAYDLFGNQTQVFNVSSGGWSNQTSDGDTLLYLKPNASNTVQFDPKGLFSKNLTFTPSGKDTGTYNVSGLYNSTVTVMALDSETSSTITNFTLNISQSDNSYAVQLSTTNGTLTFPAITEWNYFLFLDADGYAYANTTLNINDTAEYYNFTAYSQNSVSITVYDEFADTILNTTTVNVDFTKGNSTSSYSTTNGTLFVDLLDAGTWTLEFSALGFDDRVYFVTVASRSHQFLSAFLLNSSLSDDTVFSIKTVDGDFITNATITMQQQFNGSWVTIDQEITDFFGQAYFSLLFNEDYRIIIEADGYITKTAQFKRVNSAYSITLTPANTQAYTPISDEFTYSVSPSSVAPEQTNFTLSTSSPQGSLEWFAISVNLNGSDYTQNVTSSPSGGTATVSLNLTNFAGKTATVTYTIASTGLDAPYSFTRAYYIYGVTAGNYTFASFMQEYGGGGDQEMSATSRAMVITVLSILLGVSLAFWVVEAGVVAAIIIWVLAIIPWNGAGSYWVHPTYGILVIFVLTGMLLWGARR